jgi:hypothetical protein
LIISGRNPPSPVNATPRSSVAAINRSSNSSSNNSRRSLRASGSGPVFTSLVTITINLLQVVDPIPLTQTI